MSVLSSLLRIILHCRYQEPHFPEPSPPHSFRPELAKEILHSIWKMNWRRGFHSREVAAAKYHGFKISLQVPTWLLQTKTQTLRQQSLEFLGELERLLRRLISAPQSEVLSDSLTSHCNSSLTQLFLYSYWSNFLKEKKPLLQ